MASTNHRKHYVKGIMKNRGGIACLGDIRKVFLLIEVMFLV